MISKKLNTKISKFLSLVLRHHPGRIGLSLDDAGWANVDELIKKLNENGQSIDRTVLDHIVATNKKKRFAFNSLGDKIRASQGHSIEIDHRFTPETPPDILFHGTGEKNERSILKQGLDKRQRHHVHLSDTIETAVQVGQRHGKPIVFEINSRDMHRDGISFFISENNVWLTEYVAVKYLKLK